MGDGDDDLGAARFDGEPRVHLGGVEGLGLRVFKVDSGKVSGLGFRVWIGRFGIWVWNLGLGLRVEGVGF